MIHSTGTPPVSEELFAFAVRLAARAGRMCAEAFHGERPSSERKPDGTEVTAVDLAVEEFVRPGAGRGVPGGRGARGGDRAAGRDVRAALGGRSRQRHPAVR
ncbi:hypothetical protein [Streptomyces sp. WAC 06783]|uniref:hypothetical protein n=1 Tax=Streptomyces sp. WAC 06783 TaxID=2203211 RepID=UPI0021ADFFA0|nr:hypothetical protein [Streptomyces sp. WAC 06783]